MKKQINGSAQTTIVALNEEYSLTISNTSHVFEADSNGAAKSSSTTIDLKGYLGQKKVKTTFVSVTGTKTGMKVTSQQLDYNTVRIQVSVDNKLTSAVGNSGELEITVSLDGIPTNQMKKIFSWSKAIAGKPGQNGSNGTNGKDGRSVTSIVEMYYKSTSATSLAGGTWSTTYPGWENGKYIWTKSVINYSSGNPDETKPVCVTGSKGTDGKNGSNGTNGAPGKDGQNGTDGISVTKVDVWYYLSTSATQLTGGTWSTNAPAWTQGKYMWSKTITTYSKGNPTESKPVCISGSKGDKGKDGTNGTNGKDGQPGKDGTSVTVTNTKVSYKVSTSGTTIPSADDWKDTVPEVPQGQFLWTKTYVKYSDGKETTTYNVSYAGKNGQNGQPGKDGQNGAPGKDGSNGQPGKDGKGIKSTATTYQIWYNGTTIPNGDWSTTPPKTTAEKPYLWTKIEITYTDNSKALPSYSVGSTIEGVQIGGRNLLWNTRFNKVLDGRYIPRNEIYTIVPELIDSKTCLKITGTDVGIWERDITAELTTGTNEINTVYTFSGFVKGVKGAKLFAAFNSENTNNTAIVEDFWSYFSIPIVSNSQYSPTLSFYFNQIGTYYLTSIKLEKGNKATDWTPAPEDAETALEDLNQIASKAQNTADSALSRANGAYFEIDSVTKTINNLVKDDNGMVSMTQTADGLQLNMTQITNKINTMFEDLEGKITQNQLEAMKHDVDKQISNVSKRTAYINADQDADGKPRITLGAADSPFKVCITNTAIEFLQNNEVIAYANGEKFFNLRTVAQLDVQIGIGPGFIWKVRDSGNLGLTYIS